MEDIRKYLTDAVESSIENRKRISGMTDALLKAEVNAYMSGLVKALMDMGKLAKSDALDIFTDLYLI